MADEQEVRKASPVKKDSAPDKALGCHGNAIEDAMEMLARRRSSKLDFTALEKLARKLRRKKSRENE